MPLSHDQLWESVQEFITSPIGLSPTDVQRSRADFQRFPPRDAIWEEVDRRHDVALGLVRQSVLGNLKLHDELQTIFSDATPQDINESIGKLSGTDIAAPTPKGFGLGTVYLYKQPTYAYLKRLPEAVFGQGIFMPVADVESLFPDIQQGRIDKHRYVLAPAGIVAYDMHVPRFGKDEKPLDATIVHAFYVSIGWLRADRQRYPYIKPMFGGESDRVWTQESLEVLGTHEQQITQTVYTAYHLAQRYMRSPYRGGAPGLQLG